MRESLWAHLMVDLQQISINGWRRDAKVLHLSQLPVNAITYQEGLLSHSTQCAGTERNWQRGILCCFTDIPRRGRHQAAAIILAGRDDSECHVLLKMESEQAGRLLATCIPSMASWRGGGGHEVRSRAGDKVLQAKRRYK